MDTFDPNYIDPAYGVPAMVAAWLLFAAVLIVQKGSAKMRARRRRRNARKLAQQ